MSNTADRLIDRLRASGSDVWPGDCPGIVDSLAGAIRDAYTATHKSEPGDQDDDRCITTPDGGCVGHGCMHDFPHTHPVLPTDSEARKQIPIFSGVLNYFPLAIAAVARLSKRGNDKHNPGEPLHWSRDKSQDHEDCIARHLLDIDTFNAEIGEYEDAVALAWRALAKLQLLEEKRLGQGPSRGSK